VGCDIHGVLEVRQRLGWSRSDAVVQELKHKALGGDVDAADDLAQIEQRGPWEVGYMAGYRESDEYLKEDLKEYEGRELPEWLAGNVKLNEWIGEVEMDDSRRRLLTKRPGGGEWSYMLAPRLELPPFMRRRNYYLFAWLTGTVRNYSKSVKGIVDEPRGLPEDMSVDAVRYYNSEGDQHSHSWVTAKEVLEAADPVVSPSFQRIKVEVEVFRTMMQKWAEAYGPTHVRLVMWFDN